MNAKLRKFSLLFIVALLMFAALPSQPAQARATESAMPDGLFQAVMDSTASPFASDAQGYGYPVTIGPLTYLEQKVVASDGEMSDSFGISVAHSGDTALVGSYWDTVGGNVIQGSVYVFVRSGTTWSQQAKLTASDGAEGDQFGISVAISGDTAIIGAAADDIDLNLNLNLDQGSAYIFTRSGTVWSQQAKLTASDGAENDAFGSSVALSSGTAVVGAHGDDVGLNNDQGSAYVFVGAGASWSEQQQLTSPDGSVGDDFGASVALSGETALVGARLNTSGLVDASQGSAYVFTRSGTVWSHQQKLTASDAASFDAFGRSVALSGETALIGAYLDESGIGSAYVFVRSGATWSEQQKLTDTDGSAGGYFGLSVALSGDTALVSAPYENIGANSGQGSAYLYTRSGSVWTQQDPLLASDGAANDAFGTSVALSGDMALIGAENATVGLNTEQGSAYFFAPSQPAILLSPSSLGFGLQPVGMTSAARTVTLTNSGGSDLHLGSISVTGDFAIVNDNCSGQTVAPSGSCTFGVTFAPTSPAAHGGSVSILSDAIPSPHTLPLSGNNVPNVVSITRADPSPSNASAVNFTVTFNKAVSGVDISDFSLSTSGVSGASIASVSGANDSYTVSVNTGAGNGTIRLDLTDNDTIVDSLNQELGGAGTGNGDFNTGETYAMSYNSAPTGITLWGASVAENQPIGTTVNSLTTTDPDAGDTHTYSLTCSAPAADDASFQISAANLQTNAVFNYETKTTYAICIRANDGHGGTFDKNFTIHINNVDDTAPSIVSIVRADASPTSLQSVRFIVTFSEAVSGVSAADFRVTRTGTLSSATVSGVTGSAARYIVTVNLGTGLGTARLDIPATASILDLSGLPLSGTPFTGGPGYSVQRTLSLLSTNTQDGWILESGETTNAGGTMGSTATSFNVGDDAADKQYRGILSFNTTPLPDNAVITKATLKLKLQGVTGTSPFTTHGNLLVDIIRGMFSANANLQLGDFNATATQNAAGVIPSAPVGGFHTRVWTSGVFTSINKLGLTQFRLRFTKDDNDDSGADFLRFFSGEAPAASRPAFIVEYHIPAPAPADADNDTFFFPADCNDADLSIHPDANEVFGDGVDNNCDGQVDEFTDADGDGWRSTQDCDDSNPNVNPGMTEIVGDGIDNDCDNVVDESN